MTQLECFGRDSVNRSEAYFKKVLDETPKSLSLLGKEIGSWAIVRWRYNVTVTTTLNSVHNRVFPR